MSGNTGQHITVKMVVGLPVFLCFWTLHILSKSALALISTPVIHSLQARRWFLPVSRSGEFLKNPLKSAHGSAMIYLYLYAHVQGLRIRAGRPIHEMGTSHIFDGKGLDSHAE